MIPTLLQQLEAFVAVPVVPRGRSARVFGALKVTPQTAAQVATRAGLKRTTTCEVLTELEAAGLAAHIVTGPRRHRGWRLK